MLKQLDTLIGFVVVMGLVSLLITVVTQMVSALLGLRGKNLADALEAMIHKVDPSIAQQPADLATQLTDRILTHPVISDSVLRMKPNFFDRVPVLAWFRRKWRLASAMRADELFAVLQDLACTTPDVAGFLGKDKSLWTTGDDTVRAIADHTGRLGLLGKWAKEGMRIKEASQTATKAAKEAAARAETAPLGEKYAALKEAMEKELAAKTMGNLFAHVVKMIAKVKEVHDGEASAKEFAREAPIRTAATKLLGALYVAPVSDSQIAAIAASHPVPSVDEWRTT